MSYYDYYQPEAYVPQTDTYIEGLLHQRADRPHTPFGDASMLTPGRHRRRLSQLHHGIGSVSYSEMVIRLHAGERVSQRISSELVALPNASAATSISGAALSACAATPSTCSRHERTRRGGFPFRRRDQSHQRVDPLTSETKAKLQTSNFASSHCHDPPDARSRH